MILRGATDAAVRVKTTDAMARIETLIYADGYDDYDGCVVAWLRGYDGWVVTMITMVAWLGGYDDYDGYVVTWLRGCVVTMITMITMVAWLRFRTYVITCLRYYVVMWLRGYVVGWLRWLR